MQIRDLDLGAQFPDIRNIKVLNADMHDTEGHLENVELLLDLEYRGNFHLSIDADMVLGKKGFLSIKGKHIYINIFTKLCESIKMKKHKMNIL